MNQIVSAAAAMAALSRPSMHGGYASFGHVSRETLNHPAGSTDIQLRRARQDRCASAMRIRLRRGRR